MQTMKARLAAGETLFGTFLTLGSPFAAESLGMLGWDWLLVDLEHGGGNEAQLVGQLMGCTAAGMFSIGNTKPESSIIGSRKKNVDVIIACCCVAEIVDTNSPSPRVVSRYTSVRPNRSR
jgi:hypothetical protein